MPFWLYEAETRRSVEQVAEVLARSVTKLRWFRPLDDSYPFAGRVDGNRFSIARVVRGSWYFNPMLYGRLTAVPAGTRVRVLFTFGPFMWILLLGVSAHASGLWSQGDAYGRLLVGAVWPVAIAVFCIRVATGKRALKEILDLRDPSR